MKVIKIFFLIILSIGCSSTDSKTSQISNEEKKSGLHSNVKSVEENHLFFNSKIKSLIIYSVDININTIIRVDCKDFQSYFNDATKRIEKDSVFINSFKNKLSNLKKDNFAQSIDTRYKIVIKYNDGKDELMCGDRFNIYFRNEYYNVDNTFLSLFYEKEDL